MRYGALGAGLFVGFANNSKYNMQFEIEQELKRVNDAVRERANELWMEHMSKETGISFNTEDANFDLEKVMEYANSMK